MKKRINGVKEELSCFIRLKNILGLGICFLIFSGILISHLFFLQPFCSFLLNKHA